MITTIQAARAIRDDQRRRGTPCPWSECMRIAAEFKREADVKEAERIKREQAAFWYSKNPKKSFARKRASIPPISTVGTTRQGPALAHGNVEVHLPKTA